MSIIKVKNENVLNALKSYKLKGKIFDCYIENRIAGKKSKWTRIKEELAFLIFMSTREISRTKMA